MGVKLGFLVTLEAKDGKGEELGEFLRAGGGGGEGEGGGRFLGVARALAPAEEETATWYAFRIDSTRYGIFDTFASENGRQAHIAGPLAEALGKTADELLASDPSIRPVDVIAVK
jgi:quinol monooxygenase YgiN